ncbi:MAG: hypothetical protein G01um101470_802, partial [Parcubacteria group bacterium Gr01-1014_70]
MISKTKKQTYIFFIFSFVIAGWIFFASHTHAASTTSIAGTLGTAVTAECDDSGGANWDSTLSAYQTSNNTYGAYSGTMFDASKQSEELQLSNFHFSIPDGSTINGIRLRKERDAGGANDIYDLVIQLSKTAGVQIGSNEASTTVAWGTSDVTDIYGGSGYLWGTTWSEAEVESSGFGVVICVQTDSGGS